MATVKEIVRAAIGTLVFIILSIMIYLALANTIVWIWTKLYETYRDIGYIW